jgi:SAM-dependent methyltransferase
MSARYDRRVEKARLARSFLDSGENYERYRPGFPEAAVSWLLPSAVSTVLDLGAGTGKLTRLLVGRAAEIIAVDPSDRMLRQLRAICPTVDARIGAAEDIPAGEASVDVVTVAQAFHWFDREAACAQIRRVLRPGGVLALVSNVPDQDCGWDLACGRIAHPWLKGEAPDQDVPPVLDALPGFEGRGSTWVRWQEDIGRVDYLRRWSTVSSLLVADDRQREDLLSRMAAVLDGDPDTRGRDLLRLRHATEVLVYRRA